MDKGVLKFIKLGDEPYPQIPPNGKWLSPKFEKSEIGNFRKQNEISPKIKFGGYGWKAAVLEQSKIVSVKSNALDSQRFYAIL